MVMVIVVTESQISNKLFYTGYLTITNYNHFLSINKHERILMESVFYALFQLSPPWLSLRTLSYDWKFSPAGSEHALIRSSVSFLKWRPLLC